jgi:hypothetical protein
VYINGTTTDGANVLSYISSAVSSTSTPKAFIIIESNTNGDNTYAIFSVTAASTSTEVAYTVTFSSGTLPSNGEVCVISFDRTGNSSTNATAVTIAAAPTNTTYYPIMVTATGASIPLYIDGGFDFNYNPYSNAFYVGYNNGGAIYTDYVTSKFSVEVGTIGAGIYVNSADFAVGDYNGNGVLTELWGTSAVEVAQLTGSGVKFLEPTTYRQPTSSAGYGDVVYYGSSGGALTAGFIYYLNTSGAWTVANSNVASSSKYMLGIALGTSISNGMLVRGYAKFAVGNYASVTVGQILYLGTTNGYFQNTAPSSTAQVVRVVGYCVDATNDIIYFCPDNTWVEIA